MDVSFLLFAVIGLAGAVGAWWQHQQRGKRREALFALAHRQRAHLPPRRRAGIANLPFRFLRRGDDRGVENV